MNAVLLMLLGTSSPVLQVKPAPIIPIPTGRVGPDYRLFTDWAPPGARPVWRTARWVEERDCWEETRVGRDDGHRRTTVARNDFWRVSARTGRRNGANPALGAGLEWDVYIGNEWSGGLDVELTPTGPRIIVALTHYPVEGVTRRYGWNVLAAEPVLARGLSFDGDALFELYLLVRVFIWEQFSALLKPLAVGLRE
jgi:hypothetical protein